MLKGNSERGNLWVFDLHKALEEPNNKGGWYCEASSNLT